MHSLRSFLTIPSQTRHQHARIEGYLGVGWAQVSLSGAGQKVLSFRVWGTTGSFSRRILKGSLGFRI